MIAKQFELSLPKAAYYGLYTIENGTLFIGEVHTFDEEEKIVDVDSINDSELFSRIYQLLSEEKKDEIEAEIEDDKASNQSFLIKKY